MSDAICHIADFAVYQDLGKKGISELKEFPPYGVLSKGSVSIPLRNLESLRKAKPWMHYCFCQVGSASQLPSLTQEFTLIQLFFRIISINAVSMI